jgi:hypothetical protein
MFLSREKYPSHLETILKLAIIIVAILVVFVLPFYWYYRFKGEGIWMFLTLFLLTSPLIAYTFKKFVYFRKDEIKIAFTNQFTVLFFTAVYNLYVFFYVGLNTFINLYIIIAFYLSSYLVVLFKTEKSILISTMKAIITLTVSLFLIINFYFSSNPTIETYRYSKNLERGRSGYNETTLINLENDIYSEYEGIRTFPDFFKMYRTYFIDYTIEDGLFGFRVVKEYKFH